jgi:hypothetical protein
MTWISQELCSQNSIFAVRILGFHPIAGSGLRKLLHTCHFSHYCLFNLAEEKVSFGFFSCSNFRFMQILNDHLLYQQLPLSQGAVLCT